jgi:hypothetical protein
MTIRSEHDLKSQMRLLECVLADASIWCSTSTTRDFNTISRRVEHEGFSFLTISLPAFCQDFERSLEVGFVGPASFVGFHKRGALPALLRGLLGQVFDTSDGTLLNEVNHLAVHAIRQICMLHKKVLLDCSEERIRSSYDNFVKTNTSVGEWERSVYEQDPLGSVHAGLPFTRACGGTRPAPDSLRETGPTCVPTLHHPDLCVDGGDRGYQTPLELRSFRTTSRLLWGQLFSADDFVVEHKRVVPRHGPGATSERLSANGRFALKEWNQRLDEWFPVSEFGIPNYGHLTELAGITLIPPEHERPVRVVAVPKTLKGPRIIAIEPACMQYTQQAVLEILVEKLERYRFTKRNINFTNQMVNQQLALRSSKDGSLATIDLKDASDRVSSRLVWEMLAAQPLLRELVFACRSHSADIPGLGVQPLARFASMGSALCFPIEAMVFYTICISAILRAQGLPSSPKSLMKVKGLVRVYGDDIIVPVDYVPSVISELEWFNLRVNANKSFWTGKFRESCGLDAYDGTQVTPVYVRRVLPRDRRNAAELVSAISLANQLYTAGYWKSAAYVRSVVERVATVPHVSKNSAILGWNSYLTKYEVHAWDNNLHRWLVRGNVVSSRTRHDPLDGHGALMKFFLKRGSEPYHDERHLERYGRPLTVYTKLRWAQPY